MNRRSFLALSGATFAGAATRVLAQSAGRQTTVETTLGKIRGYMNENVHTFKGVRYGASTAGAARFLPPAKPKAWGGIRQTTSYGPRAPQPFRRMAPEIGDALVDPGQMSEDCLFLNLWTPGPARNQRRPVMVWLHGGGFRTGSGVVCATGNPNHPGLADWTAFGSTGRSTMVFDAECRAVSDPYGEERRALDVYRGAGSTNSTSTASGSIANTNRPNAR